MVGGCSLEEGEGEVGEPGGHVGQAELLESRGVLLEACHHL